MEIKLTSTSLFKGLNEDEIDILLSKITFQRKQFLKNTLIVSQGENCDRLMLLIEGSVKGEMMNQAGKSLKIEDMDAPRVLASAFIFGKRTVFPVNITALTDVKFLIIPKPELLRLLRLNDVLLQNFLGMVSSRAQFLSEKLRFHSFKVLRAKVANYLIDESQQQSSFKLKHSQNELAELFGVARPSIGRAFLQLQDDKIIDIRYKQVTIIDKQRLLEACNE
ncbi:MAG: Crp/Fnr family transcriptional regulator [Prolixibacteraceae bacterium]|nr:Crp/Fnr family transcriptional regulator [Prolixibacteraceae bacterium]